MSMEISGNYKDYKNEYLERAQTEQDGPMSRFSTS